MSAGEIHLWRSLFCIFGVEIEFFDTKRLSTNAEIMRESFIFEDSSKLYSGTCAVIAITGSYDVLASSQVEKKNKDRYTYLQGVQSDITNLKNAITPKKNIRKCIFESPYSKKESVLSFIKDNVEFSVQKFLNKKKGRIVLYYTGHGRKKDGAWCFEDGYVTPLEIRDIFSGFYNLDPCVICDSCYSGKFCKTLKSMEGFYGATMSSSNEVNVSTDSEEGGIFSRWLFTGRTDCYKFWEQEPWLCTYDNFKLYSRPIYFISTMFHPILHIYLGNRFRNSTSNQSQVFTILLLIRRCGFFKKKNR